MAAIPSTSQEGVRLFPNLRCNTKHSVIQQETGVQSRKQFSADTYYKYEELHSRPFVTPNSEIPEDFLHLSRSFGYGSGHRATLKLLDDRTLIFIAGNLLVLLDVKTKEQRYLHSCSGGGIGAITVHPDKEYFAVSEKGNQPDIIVFEYPSLRPYRILRGGTKQVYSFVEFNHDGSLLASVGSAPDYMLTLWDWRQEEVMLSCKAIKEVYRVSFSPFKSGQLTSSGSGHINFWKMDTTVTSPKLQGFIGHFGKTVPYDIEGYVDLPDGKALSGTDWGNLLLWDGNTIKVEISRKDGQTCHAGTVQPFVLENEVLMTIGCDGVIRVWDFERINAADSNSDGSRFEMEPIDELVVGHNVSLLSVVRSSLRDSFIWFAQDSNGAIWKLDLSLTKTSPNPECLFSFHGGKIQGLDVSKKSHLMATISLDRSVKVFDFLAKRELTTSHFNQGGTALCWAPPLVSQSGGLLVTGFEDGVVRLVELCDPRRLHGVTGRSLDGDAKLSLRQAFKLHNAAVTAVAYERSGKILATGSADRTVFFFTVGEKYNPIGFIQVPGPVQALEWSPYSHSENRLLILCQNGHVVEVHSPDLKLHKPSDTLQLSELPRRSFRFRSIKSRIKREEDLARLKAIKEEKKKKREREEQLKESKQLDAEQEEEKGEEEEELTPIYTPDPASPLYCGFYSQPGHFWLSMGGFDSGYLYHCKFSENQDENPEQRQDEPFDFLPVHNADDNPICSVAFSSNGQLLLCGMNSGSIRVYPLQPGDQSLASMQAYWALSIHDNQYGHLQHIRCSHDGLFVLTAGDGGNIFSFSLLPPEKLQESLQGKQAKTLSPKADLENEMLALDIEDPAAYSLETTKQKIENDHLCQEAELKIAEKQKKLCELQKKFQKVLDINRRLPEHVRLEPEELQLDQRLYEQAERLKAQRLMEVRTQLAWEQDRSSIALKKLQDWFENSLEANMVTVVAIRTDHRVSTYPLLVLTEPSTPVRHQTSPSQPDGETDAALDHTTSNPEPAKGSGRIDEEEVLHPPVTRTARIKLGDRREERMRKAEEKAEQARAKIEKRKQEWARIFAEKPDEGYEDPEDVQAILKAKENIRDFTGVKHPRVNAEMKRGERIILEKNIHQKQIEMNTRIVALRDSKVRLVSWLHAQVQQLQKVQQRLAAHLHRPLPTLPKMLPEESPEERLRCSRSTLEQYRMLREQRYKGLEQEQQERAVSLLEQLEEAIMEKEKKEEEQKRTEDKKPSLSVSSVTREEEETPGDEEVELSELEQELQREEEIRLLHEQNSLLEEMERSVSQFDAELLLLCRQKLRLDCRLKLADLRLLTLFQEMQLLESFQKREDSLQEKLDSCIKEENSIMSKLAERNEQLELKRRDISKLQEREKALTAAFQASLGENNEYEEFLTKVLKKKIKRVKKKEQMANEEEEEDSDEYSDEEGDWDDDCYSEEGGAPLNNSVCPAGCEPALFEHTLHLCERRLVLEKLLEEEKKSAEALKTESHTLAKKEKSVQSGRKAVEDNLELINREKLEKINELDVVVPLRLHQIKYVIDGSMPSDLSEALVVDQNEVNRLQEHIQQLQADKLHQRDLHRQAHQQHAKLTQDNRELAAKIKVLEQQCNKLMIKRFGKLVDLETLQTQSGNRRLEELKQEKLLLEAAYTKEIKQWDAKVEEAHQNLMEVTSCNTEHLRAMTSLYDQKKNLQLEIKAKQKKMGRQQLQDDRRRVNQEAIRRLQELVRTQSHEAEALRREIRLLSCKWRHILPSDQTRLPRLVPLPPRQAASTLGNKHRPNNPADSDPATFSLPPLSDINGLKG